eukprot:scaffold3270_cov106-Phaeocystis_antarctica.AAC.6
MTLGVAGTSDRPAGRDYVELPDPATDGPGKCRGIPRGTRPSDGRRALDRPQKLYSTVPWRTAPRFYGASRLQRNVVRAALASVAITRRGGMSTRGRTLGLHRR